MPSTIHLTQHDTDAELWGYLERLALRRRRTVHDQAVVALEFALRQSLDGVDIEPPQAKLLEPVA